MKKIFITFSMGLALISVKGQQKQGRVVYERTVQMQLRMMGGGEEQMLPRSRTDKLEVLFANDQSLRRNLPEDMPDALVEEASGGRRVHMMVAGANDVSYADFAASRIVELRELGTKNYIVADSIRKLNWKLTGESRNILGYPCQQAVTQRVGKRMSAGMENGQLKNVEVADTMQITAWFTLAVPVPAGPEYAGQLPGLILAIDVNNGRIVYKATELTAEVAVNDIKAPAKGKKVSAEEFDKERSKMMAEMQRNRPGRGNTIRIGG